MDYEAAHDSEGSVGNTDAQFSGTASTASLPLSAATAAAAAAATANAVPLTPGADGVLVLPAGVTLDNVVVQGRDLVIRAADGTTYVIHDGAVFVPTLVVDGVSVPPLNLAALLIGSEIQPAAGPVQSSGNNFAEDVGEIQQSYLLGDLLPYTDFSSAEAGDDEVIPQTDFEPSSLLVNRNTPFGAAISRDTVNEAGLPVRAGEPAGSTPSATLTTVTGSLTYNSPDGVQSITINGVAVTGVGQTIAGAHGTLTITGIAAGSVGYSYVLGDNTLVDPDTDPFAFVVTDLDGDTATATLTIDIVDDAPTARADIDTVPAGTFGPETGNVITGTGTAGGTGGAGADTQGADGARVAQIFSVNVPANNDTTLDGSGNLQVAGQYGSLVINQDGSYSYVRNPGTPGGVSDAFTYVLRDSDGDNSTARLTINISNAAPVIAALTAANSDGNGTGGDVVVDEDDLSDGSDTSKEALTQGGTFTVTSPDGIATLTVGGHTVIINGVFTADTWTTPLGNTISVTAYDPATGVVTYSYTLTDNEAHAAATGENSLFENFAVVLTDLDGQSASDVLAARIVDDVPTALNDADALAVGTFGPETGNVITGLGTTGGAAGADTLGADGATIARIASTPVPANFDASFDGSGNLVVNGQYGVLSIKANGDYSYVRNPATPGGVNDVFTYTLTDGDGDPVNATLTIAIGNAAPTIAGLTPAGGEGGGGGDVVVDEDDLSDGSDTSKEALAQGGNFTVTSPDGIATLSIDGHAVVVNGVFTAESWTTPLGNTLSITGFNPLTGLVTYSYTLTDNEAHANANGENSLIENFAVVITDLDGQTATDVLVARIVDDVPTARDDADNIAAGTFGPESGNVITGFGTNGGTGGIGADTQGADSAKVAQIFSVNAPANSDLSADGSGNFQVAGHYGNLVINEDGSYTYTRNPATPGGVTDSFTYLLRDGDGDTSTARLTINIGNAAPTITDLTPAGEGTGGDVVVDEDDLSDGSDTSKEALTQGGTFTVTSPDGIATLTVGGHTVVIGGTFLPDTWTTPLGNTISITGYNPATGLVTYTYTLTDNENHTSAGGENSLSETFAVVLTDLDGQTANDSLVARIVDDVPTARADADAIAGGTFGPATGNVITGAGTDAGTGGAGADTLGADGAAVSRIASTPIPANFDTTFTAGNLQVSGQYGVLTMSANGQYSYVRNPGTPGGVSDVFNYTLTDGDGDTSNATLTIVIDDAAPTITNLTPKGSGGDVSVDEDDLPAGSDTSKETLTQGGNFTLASPDGVATLTIDGHQIVTGGVFSAQSWGTPLGSTLSITAYNPATGVVSYSYTLNSAQTHPNAGGENALFEDFAVSMTDLDGDSATGTLSARIVDDVPTGVNDLDVVALGTYGVAGAVTGNVLWGDEVIVSEDANATDGVADVQGADGARISFIDNAQDGAAGIAVPNQLSATIPGLYGSLKIASNGDYIYTRTQGLGGGSSEVFTYTLTDGDGDTSTATLTINIEDAFPTAGTINATLDDETLPGGLAADGGGDDTPDTSNTSGSLIGTGGDVVSGGTLSFAFLTTGAPAGFTYETAPNGTDLLIKQGGTLVITVTLNPAGGAYTITQNAPILHAAGNAENNQIFTIGYTAGDQDGDKAPGSLIINVDDDTPTASLAGYREGEGQELPLSPYLQVDETDLNINASASFASLFNTAYGADGPGTKAYALGAVAGPSGLVDTATNLAVVLSVNGSGQIEGRAGPGGPIVFTVSVDAAGTVTLDQIRAVVHSDPLNNDDVAYLNSSAAISLTVTITDKDGDPASATAYIGYALSFRDDGPSLTAAPEGQPILVVDDSTLLADATANFANVFVPTYGADGAGTVGGYALGAVAGPSGIYDVATGQQAILSVVGGVVEGRTAGGDLVFTVSVDGLGNVTLNQLRAVQHNDPADHDEPGASAATLTADNLVTLTATVTDKDGDTATATAQIGGNLQFKDDGPSLSVGERGKTILVVDDTTLGTDATANFAGIFVPNYGADGAGSVGGYTLGVVAGPSGIVDVATGLGVNLSLNGTVVEGRTAGGGNLLVFTVSVDAITGDVTLDQIRAVQHDDPADADEASSPATLTADNLITLTATVTDRDGDTAQASANIGASLQFRDDGPSIQVNYGDDNQETPFPTLQVDESFLNTNATASFAGLFSSSYGNDGPGTTTYALGVDTGSPTGLFDTLSGLEVVLSVNAGVVEGRAGAGGPLVFTLGVDASGTVTLDQIRAVKHPTADHDEAVYLNDSDLVTLTATITDKDGDPASATAYIGYSLSFRDDGPSMTATPEGQPVLVVDDSTLLTNATLNFANVFVPNYGADGAGTVGNFQLGVVAGPSGIVDVGTGLAVNLSLVSGAVEGRTNGGGNLLVFKVSVDASGNVTLDQVRAVQHNDPADTDEPGASAATLSADNLITLTATVTDKDGDTATATANIGANLQFKDDGPTLSATGEEATIVVDDSTLSTNPTANFAGVFIPNYGADGAGTVGGFTLGVVAGPSGIFDVATGQEAILSLVSGAVEGRTAGGDLVFKVSVASNGVVTVDQQRAVLHDNPADPDEPGASAAKLSADNLITLTATVTDKDGDTAQATANIGANILFKDDGPTLSISTQVTEQNLVVDDTTLGTDATVNFASMFVPHYGADGPGTLGSYTLAVTAGASGIVDVATGLAVNLSLNAGVVEGRTNGGGNLLVFTVSVDSNGNVKLDQIRAVQHNDPADHDEPGASAATLTADNLVRLSAVVTDKDGDTATATLNIGKNLQFKDDGPSITGVQGTVYLDDENSVSPYAAPNFNNGTDDFAGGTGVLAPTGTLLHNYGADGAGTVLFTGAAGLTAFNPGSPNAGGEGNFRYNVTGGGTGLEIYQVQDGVGVKVLTLTVNSATGDYTVTQNKPIDHPVQQTPFEEDKSFSITYKVTDKEGDSVTTGVLPIVVDDDVPIGADDTGTVTEATGNFNVAFVIDFSGSIDNGDLNTQLDAIRAAGQEIFAGTSGLVSIRIVGFASSATDFGVYTTSASFTAAINALNPSEPGGSRPSFDDSGTDYTAAIQKLMAVYAPSSTHNNQVFFLSDGQPTEQTGTGALSNATATAWNTFVDSNGINVTAIGVGDNIQTGPLQDINVDNGPVSPAPILLAGFDNLIDSLLAQVGGAAITGDLDANDSYGADGGRFFSITVPKAGPDVTYTWNGQSGGASQITVTGGSPINGQTSITTTTELGGTFTINFTNGQWSYTPPANVPATTTEVFLYSITDGDGDPGTAKLTITVNNDPAPTTTPVSATVDDDGLAGGNAAGTGDDVLTPPETVATGQLGIAFGPDGQGQVNFAGMHNLTATVGTETVRYAWNPLTDTLTATVDSGARSGTQLFKVVTTDAGTYTVTLLDNVLHADGNNENNAGPVALTYYVSDGSGTATTGVLNVTFDDDTPTVALSGAAAPALTVDESDLGNDTTVNFSSMFTIGYGADGAASSGSTAYALGISASGAATGLIDTATGQSIVLRLNGGQVEGRVGTVGGSLAFTVNVSSTGNVTLEQNRAVKHADATNPDDSATLSAANLVTLTLTVKDADGDTASQIANIGQALKFEDDGPQAFSNTNSVTEGGTTTGNLLTNGTDDDFGSDGAATTVPIGGITGIRAGNAVGTPVTDGTTTVTTALGTLTLGTNGSYTYAAKPNVITSATTDTFVYTIKDGDGDLSTTTLTISLTPSTLAATNDDQVTVDEAALDLNATGQDLAPGTVVGSDPNDNGETDNSNTLVGNVTGGTGSYTYALVGSNVGAYGQIQINSNGTYRYTLTKPYDASPDTNNGVTTEQNRDSFTYQATDSDGNIVTGTIFVDIVDDVPTANNDAVTQATENQPVTIDVLANDVRGADGVANSAVALVGGSQVGAGTVVYNGDGTFTFTPVAGQTGTVTFDYRITDGDGDIDTAKVTITLKADTGPTANDVIAKIDDDGLPAGNAASISGDDAQNTGEVGAGTSSEAVWTGTVNATSADVPVKYSFAGMGATGTVGQENVNYTRVTTATTDTLTATTTGGTRSGTQLFTVVLDRDTGGYTITLVNPIMHQTLNGVGGDNTENNASVVLTYTASDSDPSPDTDTGTITVDFDDDMPSVSAFSVNQSAENAAVTIALAGNYAAGADGVDLATGVTFTQPAAGGTVTYNNAGTFTFTPASGQQGSPNFTYTITDKDGDSVTQTITVNLQTDSVPVANDVAAKIDDDGLPAGNAASTSGDDAQNTSEAGAGTSSEAVWTGTVNATSNDAPVKYSFAGMPASGPVGTETVNYSRVTTATTDTLTATTTGGTRTGTVLFTVTLNVNTGDYTINLSNPIMHAVGNTENNASVVLTYTASDNDTPTPDTDTGTITVDFDDDMPSVSAFSVNQSAEGAAVSIGLAGNYVAGADGVNLATGVTFSQPASGGTVTYNNAGTFTFTPASGQEGTPSFTYTITDKDGDAVTQTITVNLISDTGPLANDVTAKIDDDGLPAGNSASTAGDDDQNVGEVGSGTSSEAVWTGTVNATAADGPVKYSFNDMGSTGTVGTENVLYTHSVTAGVDTLTATTTGGTRPETVLFTAALNTTTGAYVITLVNPIMHPTSGTEDNVSVVLTYTAADNDVVADTDTGTITIDFDDDAPTVSAFSVNQSAENAAVTIDLASHYAAGADGVDLATGVTHTSPADGTLVYNGDGTFTFTPAAGQEGSPSFTYTVTDKDGDAVTQTVTINLAEDTGPSANDVNAKIDDDGLATGNSASTAGDDDQNLGEPGVTPSEAVWTGSVNATSLDGPVSYGFAGMGVSGSVGTENVIYSHAVASGIDTLTATTTGGTRPGAVLFTAALDTVTGAYTITLVNPIMHPTSGTEDNVSVVLTYTASDSDSPTPDTDLGTITIDFDDDAPTVSAFSVNQSAENAAVTIDLTGHYAAGADGVDLATGVTFTPPATGSLVYNGDGTFTFTPASGQQGSPTFAYTVTDKDGDAVTQTVTINLVNDTAPLANDVSAKIDDDGLPAGNSASTTGDDAQNTGESGAGISNEAVWTGSVNATSLDGPVKYSFDGMGSTGAVGTENVSYTRVTTATTDTLTATTTGGSRSGTQLFTVTLDRDTGAYTVTLVNPIMHPVANTEDNVSVVVTYTASDSDTLADTDTGSITIDFDDDMPSVSAFTVAQSAENAAVSIALASHYTGGADGVDLATGVTFTQPSTGTVTYNNAGTFTFTPASGQEGSPTFTYTITDKDGDTATQTITVNLLADSAPQVVNAAAAVDDDGLAGGNAASTTGDIVATTGSSPASATETVYNGQISVNFGGDTGTVSFANLNGTTGTVGTDTVSYAWSGTTLTATITTAGARNGLTLYTVSLSPSGAYTVTLVNPVMHAAGGNETSAPVVDLTYRATDSDGDIVTTGKLSVTFNDDAPTANVDTTLTVAENAAATSGTGLLANDAVGADGATLTAVTFGAVTTTIAAVGTTTVTPAGGEGTYTFQANGTWTFDPNVNASASNQNVSFSYTITDKDGDTSTATQAVTVTNVDSPLLVIGSSAGDTTGTADDHVVPNPTGLVDGVINGGALDDKIVGDPGAVTIVPGQSANVVLVLDSSGSMDADIGGGVTRMEALEAGVNALIQNLSQTGAQNVRITVIDFDTGATNLGTFNLIVNGVVQNAAVTAAQAAVTSMSDAGNTNYEAGLQLAYDWINTNQGLAGAQVNKVLFISDGEPTYYVSNLGFNTSSDATTSMNQVLGSDLTNEPQMIIAKGYTIDAIGIALGDPSTELSRLGDIEDGIAGTGAAPNNGAALNAETAAELATSISVLGASTALAAAGNDTINGGNGNDIIFGDVLFTDALATTLGLSMAAGSGWSVFQTVENRSNLETINPDGLGTNDWNRADTLFYINANHLALSQESGRAGGNDTIDGGDGNDTIYGQEGTDTITGGIGDDVIDGGTGADSLSGGAGDDTFQFQTGDVAVGETINGGADTDTIKVLTTTDFTNLGSTALRTTNLIERILITSGQAATFTGAQLTAQLIAVNATAAAAATLNVNVTGTADLSQLTFTAFGGGNAFNQGVDIVNITGSGGNDTITGTTISDTIIGGAGNDVLFGADNDIMLNGGADFDSLSVAGGFFNNNDAQIVNIEQVVLSTAGLLELSNQSDGFEIVGSAGADTIVGSTGNDTIAGAGGADSLKGGSGNDTIVGDETDTLLDGGADTDTLQVGANFNDANDAQIANIENVTLTAAATLDLSSQTEGFTITGSGGVDSITGGGGSDTIVGAQTDTLLNGGGSTDTLQLAASFNDVNDAQIALTENITLTAAATLVLDAQTEGFIITGSAGIDSITGGAGADTIIGAANDSLLNGGGGTDTLQLAASFDDANDAQIALIENVTLTAAATLNLGAQTEGFTITGSASIDSITGGAGADTIIGAANDSLLNGGGGTDTLQLAASFDDANDAQIALIENVTLTAAATLNLSAQTEGFTISGSGGVDTITGGAGADTITGGVGLDTINVVAGTDTITDLGAGGLADNLAVSASAIAVATATGAWTASASTSNAGTASVNANGFSVNLDAATGPNGWTITNSSVTNVTLTGSDFADRITSGTAADTINAGTGSDTVTINAVTSGLNWTINVGSDVVADKVVLSHAAIGTGDNTLATVSSFNVAHDSVAVLLGAANIADGGFQTVTALQTNISAGVEVVELVNAALTGSIASDGNNGTIEGFIEAATNTIATGNYTFIVYSDTTANANAAIYSVNISDGSDPTAGNDMVVEHIMTLNSVGYGTLVDANFLDNSFVAPIVFDLDGDGAEFLSLSAGVTFDYAADGHADGTAWAGEDDGILSIDLNGDGKIGSAAEFVFGGNGLTDLQGLALVYDGNHDRVLDALDASFAKFGVWQDANSNGVSDAGEFKSLADMGITSVKLTSDGVSYDAANGDVVVHGTTTYSKADGTTGTAADASFATDADRQARTADLAAVAAAASGVVAASIVAATVAPDAQAAPAAAADEAPTAPAGVSVDPALASAPAHIGPSSLLDTAAAEPVAAKSESKGDAGDDAASTSLTAPADHGSAPAPVIDHAAGADSPAHASAFDFGGNDGHVMDALLAANMAAPAPNAAPADTLVAVQDALGDAVAVQAVDAVIEHFAGSDAPAAGAPTPAADPAALASLLLAHVGPAEPAFHAMPPIADDHSAALAAA